jgi:hypothetical protein
MRRQLAVLGMGAGDAPASAFSPEEIFGASTHKLQLQQTGSQQAGGKDISSNEPETVDWMMVPMSSRCCDAAVVLLTLAGDDEMERRRIRRGLEGGTEKRRCWWMEADGDRLEAGTAVCPVA